MGYSQIVARQLDDRRFIPPITLEPLLSLDTIEQMLENSGSRERLGFH